MNLVISPQLQGQVLCVGAVLILSLDSMFIRHVGAVDDYTALFWRAFLAGSTFLVIALIRSKQEIISRFRKIGLRPFIAGLFLTGCNFTFFFGIEYGIAANVLVIVSSSPIFSAIFSHFFVGEYAKLRTIITCVVCLGAIIFVFVMSIHQGSEGANAQIGNVSAIICAALTGAYFTMLRYCVIKDKKPVDVNAVMTVSYFLLAIVAVCIGGGLKSVNRTQYVFLFLQGSVAQMCGFMGLSMAAELISATEVSLFMLMETILGPLFVFLSGYDAIPRPAIYSGAVIIFSLAVNSTLAGREPTEVVHDELVNVEEGDDAKAVEMIDLTDVDIDTKNELEELESNKLTTLPMDSPPLDLGAASL